MIKLFASKIRQFKKETVLAPLYMILEIGAEVAIPFVMAMLIDKGIEKSDLDAIVFYGSILAILAVFALFVGVLSGVTCAKASTGFAMNLRNDMFERIQDFSFSSIDKFSPGGLITRLTTDVTNVQNAFHAIVRMAVRSVVMITAALIMVFSISPKLAIIYLFIAPILGFGLFFSILKVHPIFKRAFKRYDKLNEVISENLHAMRVVKSYVKEDVEKQKFENISSEIYEDFTKAQKRVAIQNPLIQFCVYAAMLLISWIGAKLVVSNQLTTGEMMSFFTYTMQILMNLMLMSMVFIMILIARASAQRVVEVLEEESTIKESNDPIFEVKDGSLSFRNVSFSYVDDPSKLCLENVSFDIKSGETVGIIGGTGSSKTTLIQLIPRLYDITSGELEVGGINTKDYDIKTLRNAVAVVLQKNTLFSGSVKDNLRWGNPNATMEEMKRVCELAQADGFISKMPQGYDTFIEQGGANLSGGQKQRLCIARALLKNPKIIILDDSTSAVDTKTDAMLRHAFKTDLSDITKIIIAQRINMVTDADKIIVMDGGRVDAVGTHEQLLHSNAIYQEVYNSQKTGGGDFDEKAE